MNQGKAQHAITINIQNCYKEKADTNMRFLVLHQVGLEKDHGRLARFETKGTARLIIPNLSIGSYYILYPNKFQELKQIDFEIKADIDTSEILICSDRHNNDEVNHIPIIMQLGEGESFKIKCSTYNCFWFWTDSIQVERLNHKYYITHEAKKIELTIEEYESIQRFEMGLNLFDRENTCSGSDEYELTYKEQTYSFIDGSCEWNGGAELWKQLHFKRE